TATYGLRWDVNTPLKGTNLANQPFTVTGLNDPATMMLAPRGTPLYQTTYGNVAPRLGIAWQLGENRNWDTVVRAGFGIFYDLGQGSLGGVSSYFPYYSNKIISLAPFPLSPQNAVPPPLTTNPPVSNILVADAQLKLPADLSVECRAGAVDRKQPESIFDLHRSHRAPFASGNTFI